MERHYNGHPWDKNPILEEGMYGTISLGTLELGGCNSEVAACLTE